MCRASYLDKRADVKQVSCRSLGQAFVTFWSVIPVTTMSSKIAYEETTHSQQDSQEENEPASTTLKLSDRSADESYKLFSKVQVSDPTPEEARIIRNKCLWRILPFLCIGYHLMYVDKQTVRWPRLLECRFHIAVINK